MRDDVGGESVTLFILIHWGVANSLGLKSENILLMKENKSLVCSLSFAIIDPPVEVESVA